MFPTRSNSQKRVKNQKSTDKHSSFDGLIQEDIDLSDNYLAVSLNLMQIKSYLQGHPRSPKRGRDRCHPQECCYLRDLHQLLKLPWFLLEKLELYNLQFYIHKIQKVTFRLFW